MSVERLGDGKHLCRSSWEAAVDTRCVLHRQNATWEKVFTCLLLSAPFGLPEAPHISLLCTTVSHLQQNASFCLNYHWWCDKRIESQQIMFTSRTELIKASLGRCDAPFLYLRLMIRVISVLSPPRMCCFPSRQGYLEYCVECKCVWVCVIYFSNDMNDPLKELHNLGHKDTLFLSSEDYKILRFLHAVFNI